MKHKNDPEAGDFVKVDSRRDDFYLTLYNDWNPGGFTIGVFKYGELAVVLEDYHSTNGNGCKILTQDGKVGWVNVHYLARVK